MAKPLNEHERFIGPDGQEYVRDGSVAFLVSDAEASGWDANNIDPAKAESYRGLKNKLLMQQRGGSAQKVLRTGAVAEYGDERGRAIAKQRLAWSQEAASMGADPKIQDFLYFQEAVLLPGGIVASYGPQGLVYEDLHGNPVQGTPELEQAAKAKHIEVYGEKYGQTQTGGGGYAPPPTGGGPTGQGTGPTTPQMPGPTAPPPSGGATTQPTDTSPTTPTNRPNTPTAPAPTPTAPAPTTRPAQPAPPAPPSPGGSSGRSPYPGLGGGGSAGLSEQPGLGGVAAPAPASTTTGNAAATTPPGPGAAQPGRPSTGPVQPGLGAAPGSPAGGGGVTPGLGATPPVSPPGGVAGGGAAGAVPPATQPPPQPVPPAPQYQTPRSPYPTGTQAAAPPPRAPYPGVPPTAPPRAIAMPAAFSSLPGVQMPQLQPGQQFFDPFTGKFL